jgi:hypothetical protein
MNDPEVTMANALTNKNLIAHEKALEAAGISRRSKRKLLPSGVIDNISARVIASPRMPLPTVAPGFSQTRFGQLFLAESYVPTTAVW